MLYLILITIIVVFLMSLSIYDFKLSEKINRMFYEEYINELKEMEKSLEEINFLINEKNKKNRKSR